MSTYDERVRRGAALLDQRGPADWRERIDLTIIHMRWCRTCVIGQVFFPDDVDEEDEYDDDMHGVEAYDRGVQHLLERDEFSIDDVDELIDLGFEERNPISYDALTRAWVAYLTYDTTSPTEEITL